MRAHPATSRTERTGTWRSLVAHLTGGQGVAGSNPVVPTVRKRRSEAVLSSMGGRPFARAEYVDGAQDVLRRFLVPALPKNGVDATAVGRALEPFTGHHLVTSVLEAAVLDAQLRGSGESFGSHLGAAGERASRRHPGATTRRELCRTSSPETEQPCRTQARASNGQARRYGRVEPPHRVTAGALPPAEPRRRRTSGQAPRLRCQSAELSFPPPHTDCRDHEN